MKKIFEKIPVTKTMAALLLAAVAFSPASAGAEIREGSVELSPFIGYSFFDNQHNLTDDFVYGGRLGYNFTNHFGIEGVLEYIKSDVDDRSAPWTEEGQFTSPIDDVEITMYHLDLLYHFMPERNFNPFLAAGYGFTHYNPEINNRDMAIVSLGVGAKYWLADDVALRVDLRDNMLYDESIHDLQATVGIVFAFGGNKSAKKAEPAPVVQARPEKVVPIIIVVAEEPEEKVVEKVKVLAVDPEIEKKVVVLAFEDLHFDFDKATLTPKAKMVLKESIKNLKRNPKAHIRIAGYTSAAGTDEYNQKLSERRAQAVKDYLVEEGVVLPNRLSTIGYGEDRSAEYEYIPKSLYSKAAKANMRVLFKVVVE